jgi:RsiW-degrading membrane proteinase PrsW (M82 family)
MYFWNTLRLAEDLRQKKVRDYQQMQTLAVLSAVLLIPPIALVTDWDWIGHVVVGLMAILFVYLCYKANAKGDSQDFMVRFMCITLPVSLKALLALLLFLLLLGPVLPPDSQEENIFLNLLTIAFSLIVSIRTYLWMQYAAGTRKKPPMLTAHLFPARKKGR